MNVKLLRKVQKHILEEPRRFAMGLFKLGGEPGDYIDVPFRECSANNPYERFQVVPRCGTVACIKGWAEILDRNWTERKGRMSDNDQLLSNAENWPQTFKERYSRANTPLTRARIASQRIDHFIKTKGRE